MRLILLIFLFPSILFAQNNLDSLIALPYDVMVSDLSASKEKLEAGLNKASAEGNKLALAELKAKLSQVVYLQGELGVALSYAIGAINLFEELDMPIRVGGLYCSVGYTLKRRDMAQANEYMLKGNQSSKTKPTQRN